MQDGGELLKWKNDPSVRAFSLKTHKRINGAAHLQWLRKNIQNILIILYKSIPVGDIRIDREISIKISRSYRGKGIGYIALSRVVKKGMMARIKEGNIASMNLFIKAGFRPIRYYKKGYYIYKKI